MHFESFRSWRPVLCWISIKSKYEPFIIEQLTSVGKQHKNRNEHLSFVHVLNIYISPSLKAELLGQVVQSRIKLTQDKREF